MRRVAYHEVQYSPPVTCFLQDGKAWKMVLLSFHPQELDSNFSSLISGTFRQRMVFGSIIMSVEVDTTCANPWKVIMVHIVIVLSLQGKLIRLHLNHQQVWGLIRGGLVFIEGCKMHNRHRRMGDTWWWWRWFWSWHIPPCKFAPGNFDGGTSATAESTNAWYQQCVACHCISSRAATRYQYLIHWRKWFSISISTCISSPSRAIKPTCKHFVS